MNVCIRRTERREALIIAGRLLLSRAATRRDHVTGRTASEVVVITVVTVATAAAETSTTEPAHGTSLPLLTFDVYIVLLHSVRLQWDVLTCANIFLLC